MSDYYNLEKAADVLGKTPGDLNKLRESGKIRAFRDGSTWKFRKEDIDNFLTQEIKARSSSMDLDDADDLLNDSNDEDMPTMMAETNTFDIMPSGIEIKANDDEADVIVDSGDDDLEDDDFVLGGNNDAHKSGSSSISLDDDDDDDDFASGISILDDGPSGSNIDLASDSGLSLDDSGLTLGDNPSSQSGSGSGISILQEDEPEAAPQPAPAQADDFDLDEFELDPLPGENEAPKEPDPVSTFDAPSPQEDESEVFELELNAEPESSGGDTYGVAGEGGSEESTSASKELSLEEPGDFELEPFDVQGDSKGDDDSESSSQLLELDSLGLDDINDSQPQPSIDLSKEEKSETRGIDLEKKTDSASGDGDNSFGEMGGDAGDFGGDAGFGSEGFGDGGFDSGSVEFTESSAGADTDDLYSDAASGEAAAFSTPREETSGFTGLGVLLGLVPCILLLILVGAGVWELVRSIWSWEQPSAVAGPVLDMIGGLLKLFH